MSDSATDSSPLKEGDILEGKYRIERVLGEGGMGVVVAAVHLALDSRVAIKFLGPAARARPDRIARLEREARVAARLESEHVARVLDVGGLTGSVPYIVLEYLEGEDLGRLVDRDGALPISRAVDLVLEACEAIAEAHTRGIVHRDIKPQNLFLVRRGDGSEIVKVLDFGIAKCFEREGSSAALTDTRDILGSPRYMPPEQIRSSAAVTARADVWALGCVLFELVTGKSAFDGETPADVASAVLTQRAPDARELRGDVPEGLARAIASALEPDALRRTSSAAAFAEAVAPFGSEAAQRSLSRVRARAKKRGDDVETLAGSRPPPTSDATLPDVARDETLANSAVGSPTGDIDKPAPPRGSRRGIVVAAALLVAATLTIVAWSDGQSNSDPRPSVSVTAPLVAANPSSSATVLDRPTVTPVESSAPVVAEPQASATPSMIPKPPHVASRPSRVDKQVAPARSSAPQAQASSAPCPDPMCARK